MLKQTMYKTPVLLTCNLLKKTEMLSTSQNTSRKPVLIKTGCVVVADVILSTISSVAMSQSVSSPSSTVSLRDEYWIELYNQMRVKCKLC